MYITGLLSKNNRIQVHIDDKYSFSCSMDFVLENKLFKGKEVTSKEIEELTHASEKDILKSKVMEYVYSKPYSKKEIERKLDTYSRKKYKKSLDKIMFNEIFDLVESKGYFDNEANMSKWVSHYLDKGKGERYIVQKLAGKGYESKEVIRLIKTLENTDNSEDVVTGLLDKKLKGISKISFKDKSKVIRYLLGQGFSYDLVSKTYKEYIIKNEIKEVRDS